MRESPTIREQILFAMGAFGLLAMIYLVTLFFINFYIPPAHEKLPIFVRQEPVLFIFNIVALLVFLGRFWDFVTDPLVGKWSDHSKNPKGRRIPFMRLGTLSPFFVFLLFFPLKSSVSALNVVWLAVVILLVYLFITLYMVPYFALMADICQTDKDRINIATWTGVFNSMGLILASQAPLFWTKLESAGLSPLSARQWSIGVICFAAFVFMLIPVFAIKEQKPETVPDSESLKIIFKKTFSKQYFLAYSLMTFCYLISLSLMMAGAPYFISVCLKLDIKYMSTFMPLMVVSAFVAYPLANYLAKKKGNKFLAIAALLGMALLFGYLIFLGRYPLPSKLQAALVFVLAGLPGGFITVVFASLYTDIAEYYHRESGENMAAVYFGVKNMAAKMGLVIGGVLFASLTLLGKDQENDLGIRIASAVGFVVVLVGVWIFSKYYDERVIAAKIKD